MVSRSHLFLREFTKELILNTKPSFFEASQPNPILHTIMPQVKIEEAPKQKITSVAIVKPAQIQRPANVPSLNPSVNFSAPRTSVSSTPVNKAGFIPVGNTFNLNKINELIRDNSINSIETIGVGRPLLIRKMRGGQATVTKIMLTKEDINQILNSFSIQARIPRIGGIFRAIVGNLLITAVDSEFGGGPKFVISKVA